MTWPTTYPLDIQGHLLRFGMTGAPKTYHPKHRENLRRYWICNFISLFRGFYIFYISQHGVFAFFHQQYDFHAFSGTPLAVPATLSTWPSRAHRGQHIPTLGGEAVVGNPG